MNTPDAAAPAGRSKRWRWVAMLALAGLIWALLEYSGLREQFSLQALRDGLAQRPVEGLLAFVVLFVLANLMHVPGSFFLAAALLTLGPVRGGIVTYVAATLACLSTFLVVRAVGSDALRELDGRLARRLFAQLDSRPVRSVFLLRCVFHSVPALNYALALSGVRWRHYLVGTVFGMGVSITLSTTLFDTLAASLGWLPK